MLTERNMKTRGFKGKGIWFELDPVLSRLQHPINMPQLENETPEPRVWASNITFLGGSGAIHAIGSVPAVYGSSVSPAVGYAGSRGW